MKIDLLALMTVLTPTAEMKSANLLKIQPLVLLIAPLSPAAMVFVKQMNILFSVPTVPTSIVVISSALCQNH